MPFHRPSKDPGHRFTVSWGDCDAAGIVFYPRYYEMFDASAHLMFDALGLDHHTLRQRYGVVGVPLVHTEASYRGPATFGDELLVQSATTDLGTSRLTVEHRIYKGEALIVEGKEVRVWAAAHPDDPQRLRPLPIPDDVRALLLRQ